MNASLSGQSPGPRRPLALESKPSLAQSIDALLHLITIGSIVVLLINDHIFRYIWPSWFTGKLGDVAWLIFAPVLVFVIFGAAKLNGNLARWISICVVGLVFTLANTSRYYHGVISEVFSSLAGWETQITADPTDLLTLPALIVSYRIMECPKLVWGRRSKSLGVVVIALGAFATLANSPAPPQEGITCLSSVDTELRAAAMDTHYYSMDGGMTWNSRAEMFLSLDYHHCSNWWHSPDRVDQWIILPAEHDGKEYRITRGAGIETLSSDGATWVPDPITAPISQSEAVFYRKLSDESWVLYVDGPNDVLLDPNSKNLIVSMGIRGVLLKTPETNWEWVAVGPYKRYDSTGLHLVSGNLIGEMGLSLLVGMIVFSASSWILDLKLRWLPNLLVWGAVGWLAVVFMFPPAVTNVPGFMAIIPITLGLFVFGFAGLLILISAGMSFKAVRTRRPEMLRGILLYSVLAAGLFLLPYLIWSQGGIPIYSRARDFSVILALSVLLAEIVWLRRNRNTQV